MNPSLKNITNGREVILFIGGAVILLFIAGYSLYAALPFLMGPQVTVSAHTAENGVTVVSGTTERVSYLTLDDGPIPLEEDGGFSVERAYPSGYTVLTVSGRDRFGRSITKTISFVTTSTTTYAGQKEN